MEKTIEMNPGDIGLVEWEEAPGTHCYADGVPRCEVCFRFCLYGDGPGDDRDRLLVCSVPGVPYSAAYCPDCFDADVHPYDLLVISTAICDGLENMHEGWVDVVERTVTHLGKTMDVFRKDVEDEIRALETIEVLP